MTTAPDPVSGRQTGKGVLYLAVALTAVVVYLGALRNGYALDDVLIVAMNPLTHHLGGAWQAFLEPYWPASFAAAMYRPLPIASFALDLQLDHVAWLHAVNLLWHAGVSVMVAALALRWTGSAAGAWLAGLVFAVHPVHVEAIANLVGRADLMAALFTVLTVYLAIEYDRLWWSLVALALGLLSKENAAVAPALIAWGWVAGIGRPARRRMWAYAAGWLVVGAAYAAVRWTVLHPYARLQHLAPVFVAAGPGAVRLTAVAALADVARLLVFPLTLRVDYSPAERTLVTSPLDGRLLLGAGCLVAWAVLLWFAWRRRDRVTVFGLGWIAIAFLPVANLLFPTGVLIAERTLYLPSVGLALAASAWLKHLALRPLAVLLTIVVLAGGVRTALRVPVWRDSRSVTFSILDDSPDSYAGPAGMIGIYLSEGQPKRALEALQLSTRVYDRVPTVYLEGAYAAFKLGRSRLADSLLDRLEQLCHRCLFYYQFEANTALAWGDTAVAESLLARMRRPGAP